MRSLQRPQVRLPTLTTGKGARQREEDRKKRSQDPQAELKFPDHWNEEDVRGALLAMQGWVCAFCERRLGDDRHGDVEHFRPKSATSEASHRGYWWLAYEFGNYVLSCTTCNTNYKRTRFPLKEGAAHVEYDTREQLSQEARLLVDPTEDPVESWICVNVEDRLCLVTVCTADADARLKAETTLKLFALNSDWNLVQQRIRVLDKVTGAYLRGERESLRERASHFRHQGSTVRAFLKACAPGEGLLPSRDDELLWLLEYVDKLLTLNEALNQDNVSPPLKRRIKELHWMLAVLWKHPPALDAELIECWLEDTGWKPQVEPLYRMLCEEH